MKTRIRKALNLLLYLAFCVMLGTGLLLVLRLPPGSRGGHGLSVLSWSRHEWGDFHFWTAIVFSLLIIAHLALAWQWLKKVAAKKRLWPIALGLAVGLIGILALLALPVKKEEQRGKGKGRHGNEEAMLSSPGATRKSASSHRGQSLIRCGVNRQADEASAGF